MPKRTHKDKIDNISRKIRRLEKRLQKYTSDSSDEDLYGSDRYVNRLNRSNTVPLESDSEIPILPLSDSDYSIAESSRPKSVVVTQNTVDTNTTVNPGGNAEPLATTSVTPVPLPMPSTETVSLPEEILEALGDPKAKEEVFGPTIPEEIAKRWGRVLVDGLTKDQKQQIVEKCLIPDNFRLAKAPVLNPEITHVLSDAARNRDKLMEKSQNQLGRGISELTNLATTVIGKDMTKVEILKKISDISQIFLDLHYEDTKRRRKLVASSLDKKFLYMVTDVKRDAYLFGANLGEKIKASKTAERSGLQIRRNDATPTTSKKYPQQGNWRGPPQVQGQRANRQGGPRSRYTSQQNRRPPPPGDRAQRTTTRAKPKVPKS